MSKKPHDAPATRKTAKKLANKLYEPPPCRPWDKKQSALQVVVVDQDGSPIPGATITIDYTDRKNKPAQMSKRTTKTGAICFKGANAVRADSCSVKVSAKRCTPATWTGNADIVLAQTTVVKVQLQRPYCVPGFLTEDLKASNNKSFTAEDINYAARAVYGEASNNDDDRLAVASVIWNRLNNKKFPPVENTLMGVISQKGQFEAIKKRSSRTAAPTNISSSQTTSANLSAKQ